MLFYHFTSRENWERIQLEGLTRGEAPISANRWENAVNLTTDSSPLGHGLSDGGPKPPELIAQFVKVYGRPPPSLNWADKTAVRIRVKLGSADRNLKKWDSWARKRVEPDFLQVLHRVAGPPYGKHKTWWLYFGVVPPSAFVGVDFLDGK
jgi:hypothetical protein